MRFCSRRTPGGQLVPRFLVVNKRDGGGDVLVNDLVKEDVSFIGLR